MVTTRHGWAGSERPSGPSHDDNPAVVYRDSLSRGSYWAVHHALVTIAELLDRVPDTGPAMTGINNLEARLNQIADEDVFIRACFDQVGAEQVIRG